MTIPVTPLRFSKHEGKTLEWVMFHDPGFLWFMERKMQAGNSFPLDSLQYQRFQELMRRAKHLSTTSLCGKCNKKPSTEMIIDSQGGLCGVVLSCNVCASVIQKTNGGIAVNASFYPDYFKNYDKTGVKFLLPKIKEAFFGNKSHKMTQSAMEAFFNDAKNFVNF